MAHPCFVLGLFDTGLAAVRALGRAGLPVYGFDHRPTEPGFLSRYGSHSVCPHPADETALVEFLRTRARAFAERPFLFPTSDAFVAFVSAHRDALEPDMAHALPSREDVAAALDKSRQYARAAAAGVPTAVTHTPATLEEVRGMTASLAFPVVVKPLVGHESRETLGGQKAVRVDTAAELERVYQRLVSTGHSALTQSLIAGPNSSHCKVCAYFDCHGRPLAVMCMRKLRQFPVDFGVGTLMESVAEPELESIGLRFFRAMNWRGPGSIEFKRDSRDGEWKLIELNPRLWQQHALAAACGMNFPLLQYRDLAGRPQSVHSYRLGVRWLDEFRDPRSAWEHRSRGALTLPQWARSLAAVRVGALWAADDPAPFRAALRHHLRRAMRAAWTVLAADPAG